MGGGKRGGEWIEQVIQCGGSGLAYDYIVKMVWSPPPGGGGEGGRGERLNIHSGRGR